MSYFDRQGDSDDGAAIAIGGIVALIVGYLFGQSIGKDRAWDDANAWAVRTTSQCEQSYRAARYSSVTECLKNAVAEAQQAQLQVEQNDGPSDPRR